MQIIGLIIRIREAGFLFLSFFSFPFFPLFSLIFRNNVCISLFSFFFFLLRLVVFSFRINATTRNPKQLPQNDRCIRKQQKLRLAEKIGNQSVIFSNSILVKSSHCHHTEVKGISCKYQLWEMHGEFPVHVHD